MCRNIRALHNFEPPATDDEVQAAALQYVRKVSGSTKPSAANAAAFDAAVSAVAAATATLLDSMVTNAQPRDREVEAAKARAVMLTSPIQEGTTLVVVASRGGDDNHPAWFLNLSANPQVEVAYQGKP